MMIASGKVAARDARPRPGPESPLGANSLAAEINAAHLACKAAAGHALEHAIQAGKLLIEAKSRCQHGEWGQWLADHFHGSKRSAQVYMRLAAHANELQSKSAEAAHLSIEQALEAATPAKRPPLVTIAEKAASNGWCLTLMYAFGAIINYGAGLRIPELHRLRWLYPSQGFITAEQLGEAILSIPERPFAVFLEACRFFDCAEDDPDWQLSVDSITGAMVGFEKVALRRGQLR